MALRLGCPIADERSDRGKGPAATMLPEDEADSIESAIEMPVSSANEAILTQHQEDGGPVVLDRHANGSEETRNASCRKCDHHRPARPG